MTTQVNVVVGGSLDRALEEFASIWKRAEAGEHVEPKRVLAFESWAGMLSVLSTERYRLLQHLHGHEEPSISALARSLNRPYRRVHDDVVALADAGLIERSNRSIKALADSITAEIVFGQEPANDPSKAHKETA